MDDRHCGNISERDIVKLLVDICRKHKTVLDNVMSEINIHPSQHHMLFFLSLAKPNISQKEIAETLEISSAAVAVSLKKLETSGYIKRNVSEKDGRFNEIMITDGGREIIAESCKIFDSVNEIVFGNFSSEELGFLYSAALRMDKNISEHLKNASRAEERN